MGDSNFDAATAGTGAPIPGALRVITGTAACALAGANLLLVLSISKFENIFRDMLGSQPLPPLTSLVLGARWFLLILAVGLVAAAVSAFFIRTKLTFVWAASVAIFVSIVSIPTVASAMFLPLQALVADVQQR